MIKNKRAFNAATRLPPVCLLKISNIDCDGILWARPIESKYNTINPRVLFVTQDNDQNLNIGDRLLCKLTASNDEDIDYEARLIRRIGTSPKKILGLYRSGSAGGRIVPIDKKNDQEWQVSVVDGLDAKDGELVEADQIGPKARFGLPKAKISAVLGDPMSPKSISLIAIHHHGIPDHFPNNVVSEADDLKALKRGERKDLRELPLFTIDPSDARDHDDAICAFPDLDPHKQRRAYYLGSDS